MRHRLPSHRTARGNRVALALIGMVLIAAGSAVFAAPAHAAILPVSDTRIGSWWWAIGGGAAVVALVCVRWLLVQGRRDTFGSFGLEPDTTAGLTRLPTRVLEGAAETELRALPGVSRASATFAGWPGDPELRLALSLDEGADLAAVRRAVAGEVVAHLCEALEVVVLPVQLSVVLDTSRARRAPTVLSESEGSE